MHGGVPRVSSEQFFMGTLSHDPALIQHDDVIHPVKINQSMSYQ
mgnify:FL=1